LNVVGSASRGSRQSAGQGPVGVGDLSGSHVQGDLAGTQVADAGDDGLGHLERRVVWGVVGGDGCRHTRNGDGSDGNSTGGCATDEPAPGQSGHVELPFLVPLLGGDRPAVCRPERLRQGWGPWVARPKFVVGLRPDWSAVGQAAAPRGRGSGATDGSLWLSTRVELTEEEVARRAGVSEQRVSELEALGIVARASEPDETFGRGDVLRIQLVEELESSGIPAARVAEAISAGALSLSYLDRFPDPPPRSSQTPADLCEDLGVSFQLLERIFSAFGLPHPQRDDPVREDDLSVVSQLSILFTAGLGEAEVLRAARVWGEGVRRVAQHQVHSFHELIEEPFRRRGLSDDEALDAALSQIGVRLIPYVNQLVAWLYGRHFERSATEHRLAHMEAALDAAGLHRRPAPHREACVFVDLSGSTRVTDQHGDVAARLAALAGPAQVLVGETARAHANTNGVRFEDVGPVSVKGVARPVHVFRALRDQT
jgi:Adenylate cyclase regulatory domain